MVEIGGVQIQRQAVEVAEEISQEFIEGGSDGLLGLACELRYVLERSIEADLFETQVPRLNTNRRP